MPSKGYTTNALVGEELGRSLTVGQQTQADGLIEEAEALVDGLTGRAWATASPVVAELHVVQGRIVYLDHPPVSAVQAVTIRSAAIGAVPSTLVAGVGYELLDAANGILAIGGYSSVDVVAGGAYGSADLTLGGFYALGALVAVTYTASVPVPADIRRATTMLVARWMTPRLDPAMHALESVSVAQNDLTLRYRDMQADVPDAIMTILRRHRRMVLA